MTQDEVRHQIDNHVSQNLDFYIGQLARLCAQPSISAKHEGIEACAQLVAEMLGQQVSADRRAKGRVRLPGLSHLRLAGH